MGSATVSFGLVSIPVKVFSASQPAADVSFNQIHKTCGSRLKQQLICSKDGEVVPREDIVKGYEFAKGQYVLFSPEELKALEEKATQTVDITEFVPAEKIDPVYFDKAYYLAPDKGGERAYRLRLSLAKLIGSNRFVFRSLPIFLSDQCEGFVGMTSRLPPLDLRSHRPRQDESED